MADPSGSAQPDQQKSPTCCRKCCRHFPVRILMAVLLHLALQNNFNTRVVLNVAIVEMVAPEDTGNITVVACPNYGIPQITQSAEQYPWPRATKALVLYAFYIGYLVTQVPGGWLADRYGSRYVLLGSVIITTASTALFPIMTQQGGYLCAVFLRFILGAGHGPAMPALSTMINAWFPSNERAGLGGLAFAGTNLGTILGNILTGILIHSFDGWPISFYFWSLYSGCYFFLVLIFVFSNPHVHPFISEEEVKYIESNTRPSMKKSLHVPWKKILMNAPYWANIAAQFGHNYIYFTIVTYLPTYMREILQFDVANDGLFAAVPFIALWLTSLFLSATAKYFIQFMSEQSFNKICGAGSNVVSTALILLAVYMGCNRLAVILLYIISMIIKAFYYVTLPVNINALSRNYGGIMFGLCNAIGSISGIIGNLLIGSITKDRQIYEWRIVFWVTLGIETVTTIIFFLFASVDRQEFDYQEDEPRD